MQQESAALTLTTISPEGTEAIGAALGSLLQAGDCVTLSGELGGGKTCFTRGVVRGAVPSAADQVASPTFAIMNEYQGPLPIYHYDCYRLRGADDAIEMGLEEHLYVSGICLIEWPERVQGILPAERLEVSFSYTGESSRRLTLVPHGARAGKLVEKLASMQESLKKFLSV